MRSNSLHNAREVDLDHPSQRALALAPWLQLLPQRAQAEQCAEEDDNAVDAGEADDDMARRARRVLQGLLHSDAAPIPAWIEATEHLHSPGGSVRDLRPTERLDEICRDREAVLTLGLCAALQHWVDALDHEPCCKHIPIKTAGQSGIFCRLMLSISRPGRGGPAVLRPSTEHGAQGQGFATSPAAMDLVEHHLRPCLQNLARLYDGDGASFGRWARLPPYRGHGIALTLWSRAWSVAVTAVWLDWMNHSAGGDLGAALERVRSGEPHRFTPLPRVRAAPVGASACCHPTALPSKSRELQFDLLADIVVAQVLSHDPARWAALEQGQWRFAVPLATKTLIQRGTERRDPVLGMRRHISQYRQIELKQVYMAAVLGCCDWPLQRHTPAPPIVPARARRRPRAVRPQSAPSLCASAGAAQRPMFEELVRAQSLMAALSGTRSGAAALPPWAAAARGGTAQQRLAAGAVVLSPGTGLGWQLPSGSGLHADLGSPAGQGVLGSMDLAALQALPAHWLQTSLLLHQDGGWTPLPLDSREPAGLEAPVDGTDGAANRLWLGLADRELDGLAALGLALDRLQGALHATGGGTWALRRAGTGAFLIGMLDLGGQSQS